MMIINYKQNANINAGDNMKLALKFFALLVLGLLTVLIIYPFLHESGHSLAVLLLGGRVERFNILPVPYILCQMNEYNKIDFLIVGFSGMLLPYIISFFVQKSNFWLCYLKIALRFVCLISFVLGVVSAYLYKKGSVMRNDDVTTILQNSPEYLIFCFVLLILLSIVTIALFLKDISRLKKLV